MSTQNDSALAAPCPSVETTPVGLVFHDDLTFDEWSMIGSRFGTALQAAAWCIGDWLVYGERKWGKQLLLPGVEYDAPAGRIPSEVYDRALDSTGLDRATLQTYAWVARAIPRESRIPALTFGHHRLLAGLSEQKRAAWLSVLDSESSAARPTVKRLAASIRLAGDEPRIVDREEIIGQGSRHGHDNYVPHLQRLLTVLRATIPQMGERQREALRDDVQPLLDLLCDL